MSSRLTAALQRLPVLARSRRSRAARQFLRERAPKPTSAADRKSKASRRRDGVREYTMTSITRPGVNGTSRAASVPFLRMSGRWLDRCGFPIGSRIYLKSEPGRLVLTTEDPANVSPQMGKE